MMASTAPRLPEIAPTVGARGRAASLVATASLEIAPQDAMGDKRLSQLLAPGRDVFVSHPGSVTHHDIVAACAQLRRSGFVPVPHVAARRLASFTQASDFVQRAIGEAEVDTILLIGGDPDRPVGPFPDSFTLLASGVLERHGLRRVAFAGYPEGHPAIAGRTLDAALRNKIALAERLGLQPIVVTQFGFEAEPVRRWIAALRADGISCPVRVGVAGPASIATLAKFAVRCGIGASLRALARGHAAFARTLTEASPDALIAALAEEHGTAEAVDGLHVFTFGGVERTARWMQRYR